jgi:hypothetical protein
MSDRIEDSMVETALKHTVITEIFMYY